MKKLKVLWIVLIIFCCLIVIGGFLYLFYRLYINNIYKRKRPWLDIVSQVKSQSIKYMDDENFNSLLPRQSMSPLIEEYLPYELRKHCVQRKMVTQLQFNDPPLLHDKLKDEWNEMDSKSISYFIMMTKN